MALIPHLVGANEDSMTGAKASSLSDLLLHLPHHAVLIFLLDCDRACHAPLAAHVVRVKLAVQSSDIARHEPDNRRVFKQKFSPILAPRTVARFIADVSVLAEGLASFQRHAVGEDVEVVPPASAGVVACHGGVIARQGRT